MFASIRKALVLAMASLFLMSSAALAQDGGLKITTPTNYMKVKSGTKITVSGTIQAPNVVSVMVDPAWSHEFYATTSGKTFTTSKLTAPKVARSRTYRIDANGYDRAGNNIAEAFVYIIVTP